MRIRDGQPTCADIPVVFMTARVQLSEVGHYKEIGAVDVIAKPFHPMTISDEVGHIRETWHA